MSFGRMDCHALTDVGRRRPENEDQFLIADLVRAVRVQMTSLNHDDHAELTGHSQGKVFLIADGVGGRAAGRRASALAVDETINYIVNRMRWFAFRESPRGDDTNTLAMDLANAVTYCQQRIQNEAECNPDKQGMGTTLTIAIVDWPTLNVVHAGDSRCYVLHGGILNQITRDHTLAQSLRDSGEISTDAAVGSALENTLWNVVGGRSDKLEPEVRQLELSIGDTLLLCTDGLTRHVSDVELTEILGQRSTAKELCHELVNTANTKGGTDNITAVIARFLDRDGAPQTCETETDIQEPTSKQATETEHPGRADAISTADVPE